MIKKYREKGIIRAEQYQGTDEQQRKYGILRIKRSLTERFHDYLFTNYSSNSLSVVENGDWIVSFEDGSYRILPDDFFQQTYEEVEKYDETRGSD